MQSKVNAKRFKYVICFYSTFFVKMSQFSIYESINISVKEKPTALQGFVIIICLSSFAAVYKENVSLVNHQFALFFI